MLPKSQFWRHVFVSSQHVGPTQKHVADIMQCQASFCVLYFQKSILPRNLQVSNLHPPFSKNHLAGAISGLLLGGK
jgi:hypothetical protein